MIVDTSAIMAIALGEPGYRQVEEALAQDGPKLMSAPTFVELQAVMLRRLDTKGRRLVGQLLRDANISIADFTERQAEIAARAYEDYGKGGGHPAGLNLGGTFSYALAIDRHQPLLYVGNDFTQTDVRSALVGSNDVQDL